MTTYPYYFEWATTCADLDRVIVLSDDRPEYELQYAALLALADD